MPRFLPRRELKVHVPKYFVFLVQKECYVTYPSFLLYSNYQREEQRDFSTCTERQTTRALWLTSGHSKHLHSRVHLQRCRYLRLIRRLLWLWLTDVWDFQGPFSQQSLTCKHRCDNIISYGPIPFGVSQPFRRDSRRNTTEIEQGPQLMFLITPVLFVKGLIAPVRIRRQTPVCCLSYL